MKLKQESQKELEEFPEIDEIIRHRNAFWDMLDGLKHIDYPQRLYEKEYYLDEGLGESLQAHVERIKRDFPDVEVQTRRDRDGFAIIKTKFKPKYKYNLDEIIKYNPKDFKANMKESLEAVMRRMFPGG